MAEPAQQRRLARLLRLPAVLAILSAVLLFSLCAAFLYPRYAINDDLKIIAILAGYPAGNPAPFPVFSNVLLGLALVPLYALRTPVNWEIWLFLVVDILSTAAVLYLLLTGALVDRAKALAVLIVLISASYFALNITFTNAAAFACFAGLCLALASVPSSARIRWRLAGSGILLIFVGSLIRLEMVAFALPLILVAAIFQLRKLSLKNLLIVALCAAAVVLAGVAFDRLYVRLHPDWNAYYFYNKTAQQLQGAHRLENTGMTIKHISWSKNDEELFARSFFPDAKLYAVERIEYLIRHVSGTGSDPLGSARLFAERLVTPSVLPAVLMVVALWMLALAQRPAWWRALVSTGILLVPPAENIFLVWFYKDPDYVLLPSLATAAMLIVLVMAWPGQPPFGAARISPRSPRQVWYLLTVLGVLAATATVMAHTALQSNGNRLRRLAYQEILSDLHNLQAEGRLAPDAIVVSPSHGIPWEWSDPLRLDFPSLPYLDTGWITFSPAYDQALQHYDLYPLPQALYQKPNVYLMTKLSLQNYLSLYYAEHEHLTVTYDNIYTMPNPNDQLRYDNILLYKVRAAP